ncbi:MAG TPA: DsbA family protein [Candidatus Angelobacter sp.]|nr:DsbA family protein [Candidatus Angelobacter sp.]
MRIPALTAMLIFFAACAAAQCPVSGDASACTTPQSNSAPASQAAGAKKKAAAPSGKAPARAAAAASPVPSAVPDMITRTQADAILVELKEIHALLQKQQPAAPAIDFSKFDFESFLPVKLAADGRRDNNLGKAEAPVTMVEFSDYQCSHCAKFHGETFPSIKAKYIDTGKVRFVSRDLPLPFHPWAMIAAEASRCAGDQQKYWEMRDALMRRSEELSPAVIEQVAQAIPLDMGLYHACTESRKYYSAIRQDEEAAMTAQIPATPGFVIGKNVDGVTEGKRVMGALPLEQFEKLIEEALAAKP